MTDEEWKSINEIYKKEFPDEMPFDKVSAKLDTMNNHPYIQELRSTFCNALVFVLTEGFVKCDDNILDTYNGSLLKLVYENIEKQFGACFIDSVLDTVLLLHKLFCMVHQCGKWRYNYQSVTDGSLFQHICPRYALDGTVEMCLGLK